MSDSSLPQIFEPISQVLAQLTTTKEVFAFCRDLMSESEMQEFARRFAVAQMLADGRSYVEIEAQTGMSSTTIARVSKYLKGSYGGYRQALGISKKLS